MRLSDLKAGSNTKQTLLLPVASHYPIEMTVICGSCPGKTLVVTAGVHGCEYVGIMTLRQALCPTVPGQDPGTGDPAAAGQW